MDDGPPTVLGDYLVGAELGRGGMGRVYEGRHRVTRRRVAIKVLFRDLAHRRSIERFRRENTALRTLHHPHIVRAHTRVFHTEDDCWWYAMDRVRGASLRELVAHAAPLPPGRVLHLWREVARAAAHVHGFGLLHRDIKPSNVLVRPATHWRHERAVVIDFGLVRDLHDDSAVRLSAADAILGTPGYLAPEGYDGSAQLDERSDVYALGLVAHAMLTGTLQYPRKLPPVDLFRQLRPGGDEVALFTLVDECLAPDPAARPEADEVVRRLDELAIPWTRRDAHRFWREWAAKRDTCETPTRAERPPRSAMLEACVSYSSP